MILEELKQKYGDTRIFVVPNKIFSKDQKPYIKIHNHNAFEILFNALGEFKLRYEMEIDESFRQIIPYCLIKFHDNYFIIKRIKGDNRLITKYSIGIGGHIEENPEVSNNYIYKSMIRELKEELDIKSKIIKIDPIGLIYTNKTEVDRVHVGLVYIVEVDGTNVQIKEKDTLSGYWITKNRLYNFEGEFETWSKICLNNIL